MNAPKVAHLTSVHAVTDPRILYKQCATLVDFGYDVVLIAPHDHDEIKAGVRIRAVPQELNRFHRMTRTLLELYRAAVAEKAALYHFHDPELIPVGLLLKLRGAKVVYDVHEDYVTGIRQKRYLPKPARFVLAELFRITEAVASRFFELVLAERYYAQRLPRGIPVLNYPLRESLPAGTQPAVSSSGVVRLLYTGVVSEDRGALVHAALVHLRDDVEVHVVGRCSPELAERMRAVAGGRRHRLHIIGEGYHVPYEQVVQTYIQGNWTAGLALLPSTPHYREKELTKFFEYMAAGIPVLCSDFPAWKALIETVGCGLCLDPTDAAELRAALDYLIANPKKARMMGFRGQQAVKRRYNWTCEAATLLKLYESLIGSPSPEHHGRHVADAANA